MSKAERPFNMVLFPFSRGADTGSLVSGILAASALRKAGYDVRILLPVEGYGAELCRQYEMPYTITDRCGITPFRLHKNVLRRAFRMSVSSVRAFAFALFHLRKANVGCVHVNDDSGILPWGLAARLHRIPVVWHVRQARPGRSDGLRRRLATKCIFISEYVRSRFPAATEGHVLHNPIDCKRFKPLDSKAVWRERLGLPEVTTIIYVGRFAPYKRVEWVVECVRRSLKWQTPVQAVMVGPIWPDQKEKLLRNADDGVKSRIIFSGRVGNVEDYMNASDILAHPAQGEPMGRTLLEAQACGVPVVVSIAVGGGKEVMIHGRTGYVAEPDSVDAFCAAIEYLVEDGPARHKMSMNAAVYAQEFCSETYQKKIETVYQDLLCPLLSIPASSASARDAQV